MKAHEAKALVRNWAKGYGLAYSKLTSKTVRFSDLARDASVFVEVHGWKPSPHWNKVRILAREHGFCIEI